MKKLWKSTWPAIVCVALAAGLLPVPVKAAADISPSAAAALAQVLQEQLAQYGQGALGPEPSAYPVTSGLAYAQVDDLDQDGSWELLLTRIEDMAAYLEIYRATGDGCSRIYTAETRYAGGYSMEEYGLHYTADGKAYVYCDYWGMHSGEEIQVMNHYAPDGTAVTVADYSKEQPLMGFNTGYLEAPTNDIYVVLNELSQVTGSGDDTAAALLEQLPYVGDRSKCKMDARMARAYAQAIESQSPVFHDQYSDISHPLRAILVDAAGDGMPLLATAYAANEELYNFSLWTWDGSRAVPYDFDVDIQGAYASMYQFGSHDGKSVLYVGDSISGAMEPVSGSLYYEISNGMLHLTEQNTTYYATTDDGTIAYGSKLPLVQSQRVDERRVSASVKALLSAGWNWQGNAMLALHMVNGQAVDPDDLGGDPFLAYEDRQILFDAGGSYMMAVPWGTGESVQQQLASYADALTAGPAYDYPDVTDDEDAYVRAVAEAAAAAVGGEITAIYELADGVYYVIITVDGSVCGALVQGVRQNGQVVWKVTETHDTPLEPEALDETVAAILSASNITVDYDRVSSGDAADCKTYLQSILDNMNGLTPNDAAKQELAGLIESAISAGCSGSVSGQDNRLELGAAQLSGLTGQAAQLRQELEQLLADNGVELNRPLVIRIRILWDNLDWGAPCQVTLNQALLDAMDGCTMQVLLGDGQHGVTLSPETVQALVDQYGSVDVRIAAGADGVYTIQFVDAAGKVLDQLDTPVTVFLPCASPTATVMATYLGGSDNWGGQYDAQSGVISFDVRYSGDYQVLENAVEINDIADLPEELQQAIRFMVSKGYFSLRDGSFLPGEPLNRYAFSEALVGMFFALDREVQTTFTDVPAGSAYYPYVASGEHSQIIEGFEDGTFRGDTALTVEQMLALAARTLMEQKGYTEPIDPQQYLGGFSDGVDTSEWAVSQVALAIREGLMDPGGALHPREPVTRAQAAQILYRLFLLLHEVSPVALDLPPVTEDPAAPAAEETEPKESSIPAAVPIVAAVGGGTAAVWYGLRKRKH